MDETRYLSHAVYLDAVCKTDDSLMPGRILETVSYG
jgi:hypothetical protein